MATLVLLAVLLTGTAALASDPGSLPSPLPDRVSVASDGTQSDADAIGARLSADGRFVVFASAASTLVPMATNGFPHVYLHDRQTHETRIVDLASDGTLADAGSWQAAVSDDGRFVAFRSTATNLIAGGTTRGPSHVYVRDLVAGHTSMIDESLDGVSLRESPHASLDLSGDGRVVAFAAVDARGVSGVFLFDRAAIRTTRASVSSDGTPGDGQAWAPSLSADGRFVVFVSNAPNLVTGDGNGDWDAFVHDRLTGRTTLVSHGPDGAQIGGNFAHISADGRHVAFTTVTTRAAYVHDRATGATTVGSHSAAGQPVPAWNPRTSGDGRMLVFGTAAALVPSDVNGKADYYVYDRVFDTVRLLSVGLSPSSGTETASQVMALSADGRTAAFDSPQTDLVADDTNGKVDCFTRSLDADNDGLMDDWEYAFGLDPLGSAEAQLDLDADGLSVAAEARAGSHPRGLVRRHFAEGVTGPFFETTLAMSNVSPVTAQVLLTCERADGLGVEHGLTLAAGESRTLDLATIPGLSQAEFSTLVESNTPIAAERRVTWRGAGAHGESGMAEASPAWYFAEGATLNGFDLFYLLQNPGAVDTDVDITYLFADARPPLTLRYPLPARSRVTVWVNQEDARLRQAEIGAIVRANHDVPIVVERSMYLSTATQVFRAGHVAAGETTPASRWYLAEGATGDYFDAFILIANPSAREAQVQVRFLLPDGSTLTRERTVEAGHRATLWVDMEDARLSATSFSAVVTSRDDVPIVVERVMWWPGPTAGTWHGTHVAAALPAPAARWRFALPDSGATASLDTYLLLANTEERPRAAMVRIRHASGHEDAEPLVLPASSRTTISLEGTFAGLSTDPCAEVAVEARDGDAALVAERATYERDDDGGWMDGAAVRGTPLASIFTDEDAFRAGGALPDVASFNVLPPGLNGQCSAPCALVLQVGDVDVTLTSEGQALVDASSPYFPPGTAVLVSTVHDSGNNVVLALPAGTTAAGIRMAVSGPITVTAVDDAGDATMTTFDQAPGFVGFRAHAGIRTVRLSAPVDGGPASTIAIEAILHAR